MTNSSQEVKIPKLSSALSCYLIGSSSLAVQCGQVLLEAGYSILGVMSQDPKVLEWTVQQGIYYTDDLETFEVKLKETPFDYLFSIFNKFILSESIVNMPRQLAINCHDAPLPKYAGTNATSWAILNGETYHGITWHILSGRVDAGDILQQAIFPINPKETALSLNFKCYDYARTEFIKLVKKISKNTLERFSQNLQERTFFKSDKKPNNNAFIDWNTAAEEIDRLHRALDFGEYANSLALPKFTFGGNVIIPKQIIVLALSTELSGTIVRIHPQSIEIATNTRNVLLKGCVDLIGRNINLHDLATTWNIRAGDLLTSPSFDYIQAIDKRTFQCARHEAFWVKTFTQTITSTSEPFVDQNKERYQSVSKIVDLTSIQNFDLKCSESKNKPYLALLTVLLMYLYRINAHQNLSLYFSNRRFKDISGTSNNTFAEFIPFTTDFKAETNFEHAIQNVSEALEKFEKHGTYATDIFCRYPCLKNHHTIHWAVDVTDNLDNYQTNCLSSMIIAMNHQGNKFRLFSNKALIYDNSEALVDTIAAHLRCLINSILAGPQRSITYLNFIPNDELTQLQIEWNNTITSFPNNKTIVQIFEEQVLKTPNNIAVSSLEQHLTFHDLNVRANQLAHYLKNLFIIPETLIAIYLERSVDIIISILAILKAGGTYVPVDINHPKAYIQSILNNTSIVLTHYHYAAFLESFFSEKQIAHIVALDKDALVIQEEKGTNPACVSCPQNLAYVIHTSGSSGTPKGVLIEHRSVVNYAYSQIRVCGITEESCVLAFASISFDASVFEIFCSLFAGAKLYLAKKEEIIPGASLLHTLQKNKISIAQITPVALDITDAIQLPHLRTLISAGEACTAKINNQWNRENLLFINAYGPTETTVFATEKVNPNKQATPTIGKPIDNVIVYVLDQYCQPVPIGVYGELYIGGMGVARGYLNQPELTRQKFIPNPFTKSLTDPNRILYKSGDLVRWLPEGDLEYGGRVDAQVKIRGYRIELSAIESIMQTCSLVQQAVAITLMDAKEQQYIVAYIVPTVPEQNFDLNILRKHLVDRLPSYMVPQSFVILDQLPININGKVDKKSLPLPEKRLLLSDAVYVSPKTETEIELAKVWSRILNVESVGTHDNFFNLGGHSLLVTEALLHIKQAFNINLSFKSFFDEPTISQLAKIIDHQDKSTVDALPVLAFLKDALLPRDIQFKATPPLLNNRNRAGSVFLTGATGFLGGHLLNELHRVSTAKIICLIRAGDYSTALFRINKNLIKYGFRDLVNSDRIVFLLGDLTQRNLGLPEETFSMLANEVDVIYHNGAVVNHIYDFESLKKANVDSTLEIIRLAATGKQKELHFISALNAVVEITDDPIIKEDFASEKSAPLDLHNGYCQTKWVSEKLLSQVKDHGLLVNIYRPSWISGQLNTGIWEADKNHLLGFIKSCIQLGYAPDKNFRLEMWPVDCISRAIIQISLNGPQQNGVYNFTNPNTPTWHDLVTWLNQNGHPITFVPVPIWRRHCFEHMSKSNALYPFASLYLQDSDWLSGLSQEKMPKIETHHTAAVFKSLGIDYPNIDDCILKVYFDYLHRINFIETVGGLEFCA